MVEVEQAAVEEPLDLGVAEELLVAETLEPQDQLACLLRTNRNGLVVEVGGLTLDPLDVANFRQTFWKKHYQSYFQHRGFKSTMSTIKKAQFSVFCYQLSDILDFND